MKSKWTHGDTVFVKILLFPFLFILLLIWAARTDMAKEIEAGMRIKKEVEILGTKYRCEEVKE